jgi:hypothetical protein
VISQLGRRLQRQRFHGSAVYDEYSINAIYVLKGINVEYAFRDIMAAPASDGQSCCESDRGLFVWTRPKSGFPHCGGIADRTRQRAAMDNQRIPQSVDGEVQVTQRDSICGSLGAVSGANSVRRTKHLGTSIRATKS